MYLSEHDHEGGENRTRIRPMGRRYLFVYPFVKTHGWYQLPQEERQRMMDEHFEVGHRYPEVKIHTTYSYGLDDQEFVLGFETESPQKFLQLIMDLRSAEQRPYTERDTPIFTCLLGSTREVLDSLGGEDS
jgi:chlorite dismutase